MVWLAIYKRTGKGEPEIHMGNFSGGNCRDVVRKVCKVQGLHVPEDYDHECSCTFTTVSAHSASFRIKHEISVAPLDEMIKV